MTRHRSLFSYNRVPATAGNRQSGAIEVASVGDVNVSAHDGYVASSFGLPEAAIPI
jgi:hypothetical protein